MRFVLLLTMVFGMVFGMVSCEKKKNVEEGKYPIHIISEYFRKNEELQKKAKDGDTLIIPPPILPKYLYGSENFILDDSSNVYYYQRKFVIQFCGTGLEKDTIPVFENIQPEYLIKVPISSISEFVKLNIRKGERNLVKIASQKDTLNSEAYFKLLNALDNNLDFREDRDVYLAYRTTQEEDTVLYYKKHKEYYDSDSVKWDMKRIRFFVIPKPKK